jgi:hypothetical protein
VPAPEISPEAECVGSGRFVPTADIDRSEHGRWMGKCPDCGRVIELGYAGLLPIHAVVPETELGA